MDNQKAIELLKTHNEKCSGCDKLCDDLCKPAVALAISALERLIPKKPTGIVKTKVEALKVGKCPNCGAIIGEDALWCDDCGQKLDWNE